MQHHRRTLEETEVPLRVIARLRCDLSVTRLRLRRAEIKFILGGF